ncbi:glycosyltransferase family 1 protein [Neobacillus cucumis]|uniref:glycosyltransferase family 1 protein n=1 Tax=Neobacillus cucumis TaxID=1740721 RepID=UPI00196243D7|nr:glycosyltransferase family 1 protein [Neobacillus cucumis]
MDRGGAETLIMNVYRNMDRRKVQFDFVTHSTEKGDFEDEILELGGRIFKISSLGQLGPFLYLKELINIMKSNHFSAVHSHTDYQSGFPALAAKLCGIKNRICHSHSTYWQRGDSSSERITLNFLRSIIRIAATEYCSCSKEAAQFLFGKKVVDKEKVRILNNGIIPGHFIRDFKIDRKSIIRELGLPDDSKIVGHVGRFSDSKNHSFLLKVMKKLIEQDNRFNALLIGDGPIRGQIEHEALKLGIYDHIKFLGVRTDIARLMNAFDVFLFPSKFEGFGIVTVEAQCSGTPCVISDTVPNITDMGLGLVSYLSLDANIDSWCSKVSEVLIIEKPDQEKIMEEVTNRGYNIQNNVNDWVSLYGLAT